MFDTTAASTWQEGMYLIHLNQIGQLQVNLIAVMESD